MQSLIFTLNLHIYPFKIVFAFGASDDNVYLALKNNKVSDAELGESYVLGNSSGLTVFYKKAQRGLIRVKHIPDESYYKGTLAHEVDHLVNDILKTIGMKRTASSEEAYTYLTGYITYKVYQKLKPYV